MRCCILLTLCLPLGELRAGEIWPQWRGPNRDCRVAQTQWPSTVADDRLQQAFRVEMGDSYSGPIVTEDRVFVTESAGGKEFVRAIDRQSGRELWKTEWKGQMTVPFFAMANGSWIRSTPAYADGRLYVASMEDVLVCLDTTNGGETWRVDFREKYGTPNQSFGFVCSPLVIDDRVVVQTNAGLVCLARETGEVVWRSLNESGGMMAGAFSSPVVATIAGTRQLVVQTRAKLTGVAIDSGKVLWGVEVPSFRGMNILTPTVIGDRVFTSTYGGGSTLFEIVKTADSYSVNEVWKVKTEAYMSSPVVVGDSIYCHLRNQRFVCLDVETGKANWTSKPFGKYWSMVLNGQRALALDERGELLMLDLNPTEFKLVDRRTVADHPAWAHLAVVDGQVFVRDLKGLSVLEWRGDDVVQK